MRTFYILILFAGGNFLFGAQEAPNPPDKSAPKAKAPEPTPPSVAKPSQAPTTQPPKPLNAPVVPSKAPVKQVAQPSPPAPPPIVAPNFHREVRPILEASCIQCHGM
ncbi:MAG: hypothetical protein VW622_03595, partial [Opitutae bacterium]